MEILSLRDIEQFLFPRGNEIVFVGGTASAANSRYRLSSFSLRVR
jgi:hypothetical protein